MLSICSKTDIGKVRTLNQDTVYSCGSCVGTLSNLFIVADGMGGHKAGDYASAYAVNAIERIVADNNDTEPIRVMREAIETANSEIFEKSLEEDFAGMGTTLVCATVQKDTLYVANVGDSRLYVISDKIKQITKDHSLVEEMIRAGELDREVARFHPDKNIITRAIGTDPKVLIDFFEVELNKGDVILMCTDGLTNMVSDDEIEDIVKGSDDVKEIVSLLVEKANENGGKDNIGVVLARFEGMDQ